MMGAIDLQGSGRGGSLELSGAHKHEKSVKPAAAADRLHVAAHTVRN